ncbi:WAT1-related protein [Mucuna pruriens]|uniref:WAT1-related protein n=1 Tax=Mucuna pruriens TaxID=157652 RepID=A0A371GQ26_MUCPR|nr:WAT1-related protein [Mucuna pruriens]
MDSVVSEKVKLLVALLTLQLCFAGFHIVSRLALNIGVSQVVYPVYRNLIALLLLSPFAYFLEKITANQGFYLLGLYYASPTFASALQNSVPAITFVLALALRLEEANITRRDGLAKVLGTIASVGGATIITLYKGPPLLHLKMDQIDTSEVDQSSTKVQNWTWGCIYLLGHCLSWAGWIVFQVPMVKKYPAKLTLASFTFFFGLIQFLIIAAFVENDLENWKIQSQEELFIILYAGIIATGIVIYLQTWCIQKGGPVFVAVFQPVQTFLVAIMAALILGDQLYSGGNICTINFTFINEMTEVKNGLTELFNFYCRLIGAILIVLGLYLVLWGKTNEKKATEPSLTNPLLKAEEENKESDAAPKDIP